jgi:hypothetical protein
MADRNDSEVPAVVLREHEGLVGDIRFFKTQQWEIAKATVAIYVGLAAAIGMMTLTKGSNIALVLRFAFTICAFLGMGFRTHTNSKTIGFDNRSPKKTWHRPRADGYRAPSSFGLNTGRSDGKTPHRSDIDHESSFNNWHANSAICCMATGVNCRRVGPK